MARTQRPSNAGARILRSEATHAIAFFERTLIVHWLTETRELAVVELATLLASLAVEHGRVALLQVIDDQATPPDSATRAALAKMLKDNEARIAASAVVFEGAGFRASVVRSVVIGISMLSRPKCPHTVFASTSHAIEWLNRHWEGADPRHSASGIQRTIDRLKHRAAAVPP